MKDASIVLMTAGMDVSVDLIEHRYGVDAGAAARDVAVAGKNTLEASKNIRGVGIKQTAKRVITETAIKSLDSPEEARKLEEQKQAANTLVDGIKTSDTTTEARPHAFSMD